VTRGLSKKGTGELRGLTISETGREMVAAVVEVEVEGVEDSRAGVVGVDSTALLEVATKIITVVVTMTIVVEEVGAHEAEAEDAIPLDLQGDVVHKKGILHSAREAHAHARSVLRAGSVLPVPLDLAPVLHRLGAGHDHRLPHPLHAIGAGADEIGAGTVGVRQPVADDFLLRGLPLVPEVPRIEAIPVAGARVVHLRETAGVRLSQGALCVAELGRVALVLEDASPVAAPAMVTADRLMYDEKRKMPIPWMLTQGS